MKGPAWSGRPRFRYCAGFGVVLLLVACWSAVHPTAARAHAEQSRSSPEAGAALATPPTHVDVWFTERLTSGVSSIQVFDVQRRRVDTGASVIDPNDPAHMGVGLQPLPAGLYTVIWSNISADDGHPNKGGFAFTVLEQPAATPIAQQGVTGQATPASSPTPGFSVSTAPAATPLPLPSQSDQAIGQLLTPASDRATATVDLVFGWLAFMALILAGGGALFALCCVLPALRRAGDEGTGATLRLLRWFGPVVLVCAAIGGVAAFGSLLAKVEIATALPARDLFSGVVLGAMLAPWSGHIWLAQEVATLAMAPVVLVSWLATRRGDASRRAVVDRASLVILVMLAVAGLICHALDSHIGAGHVARSLPLAVAALAAHFLAVGLWAGGLGFAPLLWIVWRRAGPPLRRIIVTGVIARFSTLALPSVVVIAGTGAYLAVALVPAPSDLVSSAYGQALIVKTLLFGALVLFGAANRRTLAGVAKSLTRRGSAAPEADNVPVAGARLLRSMRWEIAIVAAVVLAASTMLEVGPPGVALSAAAVKLDDTITLAPLPTATARATAVPTAVPTATAIPSPTPYAATAVAGDLTIGLAVKSPLAGAVSAFVVDLSNAAGASVSAGQVKLFITARDDDLGIKTLTLAQASSGQYQGMAPIFAEAGAWNVQVVVRRDNAAEQSHTFLVAVAAPLVPPTPAPVAPLTTLTPQPVAPPDTMHATLAFQPNPPSSGRGEATLRLWDAARRPYQHAQVQALWLMPQHAHLDQSSLTEIASQPGTYQARVDWTMAGAWLAQVTVRTADGRTAQLRYAFNVRDAGLFGSWNAAKAGAPTPATLATQEPALPADAPAVSPTATAPEGYAVGAVAASPSATPTPVPTPPLPTSPPTAVPPSSGAQGQRQNFGTLTADVQIVPRIFQPAQVTITLTDATGKPVDNARRVDVQFAMDGMSHGARGMVAAHAGAGRYQAQGMVVVMEGPWWMALRVEQADGKLVSTVFRFIAPNDQPVGVVPALTDRPTDAVQVVDLAVYPKEVSPDQIAVTAGKAVLLEVIEVDHPVCDGSVRFDELGLQVPITADGLAAVSFTPPRSGTLSVTCNPGALALRFVG